MNDWTKTISYVAVAAGLLVLMLLTAPTFTEPETLNDEGKAIFPEFGSPALATSISIVQFDEEINNRRVFTVQRKKGKGWVVPSHQDYPAEAKERMEKTATGLIGLRWGPLRSERKDEFETFGVLDPGDEATTGRGMRIRVQNETGGILADLIVGKDVEGKKGFRYVRLPESKRTYAVEFDVELSTDFFDWIEPDLLQIERFQIDKIQIDLHRIDERMRRLIEGEVLTLTHDVSSKWSLEGQGDSEQIQQANMDELLNGINDLKIVDVKKKPDEISKDLRANEGVVKITESTARMLSQWGYYFTQDRQLRSNEGEVRVWTDTGALIRLRFGAIAAGGSAKEERRYLFLTAEFDENHFLPLDPEANDAEKEGRRKKVEEGKAKAEALTSRFADWYYIIPGDLFKKIRITRKELIEPKK